MSKTSIIKTCVFCKEDKSIPVTQEQLERINARSERIQDILPHVSAGDREMFISGICGKCFDNMF